MMHRKVDLRLACEIGTHPSWTLTNEENTLALQQSCSSLVALKAQRAVNKNAAEIFESYISSQTLFFINLVSWYVFTGI